MQCIKRSLSALLAILISPTAALATDFCIVQKSADGYVALRAMPSSAGAVILRAKQGEAVVIQKSETGDQIVSGRWLRVLHFPDTVAPQVSDPKFKKGKLGWMHSRFIGECG